MLHFILEIWYWLGLNPLTFSVEEKESLQCGTHLCGNHYATEAAGRSILGALRNTLMQYTAQQGVPHRGGGGGDSALCTMQTSPVVRGFEN